MHQNGVVTGHALHDPLDWPARGAISEFEADVDFPVRIVVVGYPFPTKFPTQNLAAIGAQSEKSPPSLLTEARLCSAVRELPAR